LEALQVAKHIEKIILALVEEGKNSNELIFAKADSAQMYDQAIGMNSASLKASGMAVTMIKDQARKESAEKLFKKIMSEESLKAHYCRIDILKAQLNGYQSIYRHLDST